MLLVTDWRWCKGMAWHDMMTAWYVGAYSDRNALQENILWGTTTWCMMLPPSFPRSISHSVTPSLTLSLHLYLSLLLHSSLPDPLNSLLIPSLSPSTPYLIQSLTLFFHPSFLSSSLFYSTTYDLPMPLPAQFTKFSTATVAPSVNKN